MTKLKAEPIIPQILSILEQGDQTGFQMIVKLKEAINGKLPCCEAAVYPVLKRLENQKIIRSYWMKSEDRERKYYSLVR